MLRQPDHTIRPSPIGALRRLGRPTPEVERCDLCRNEVPAEHEHLVDPFERRLLCACQACALLFCSEGTTKYRRVPPGIYSLPGLDLSEQRWDELQIPIGLAFFMRSSTAEQTLVVYPSPAGPTEASLDADQWQRMIAENPVLETMQPDTQGLLVNRMRDRREHYIVPIDRCYQLVGTIRVHWEGFTGGSAARAAIDRFFNDLREGARPLTEASDMTHQNKRALP